MDSERYAVEGLCPAGDLSPIVSSQGWSDCRRDAFLNLVEDAEDAREFLTL